MQNELILQIHIDYSEEFNYYAEENGHAINKREVFRGFKNEILNTIDEYNNNLKNIPKDYMDYFQGLNLNLCNQLNNLKSLIKNFK